MNAIQVLRQMHADTKVRFKLILGAEDPNSAAEQWGVLQSLLELHEELEDEFVYTPLYKEMGPGTPLGDWSFQHEADVAVVRRLIQTAGLLDPATPEWQMSIARIMDALNKHVTDEEGQIFGRVEQVWDPQRLEEAGERMQKVRESAAPVAKTRVAAAKSTRRRAVEAPSPTRRAR